MQLQIRILIFQKLSNSLTSLLLYAIIFFSVLLIAMKWMSIEKKNCICCSTIAECPDDWESFDAGQRCYKFKAVPTARYEAASALCVVSSQHYYFFFRFNLLRIIIYIHAILFHTNIRKYSNISLVGTKSPYHPSQYFFNTTITVQVASIYGICKWMRLILISS